MLTFPGAGALDGPVGGYTLIGADGVARASAVPGTLGGHRRTKVYGRLDCPGALRWIARGHYVAHRVFFADEATALAAGFRPCATCLPDRHAAWKGGSMRVRIAPRPPFDGAAVLAFLAARAVPGLERVEGDTLHRRLGEARLALCFADGHVDADVAAPTGGEVVEAIRRAHAVVDAGADPAAIAHALGGDPYLGPQVAARPGLRAPGAFDAYEVAVRAIVGQAISVAAARTILARLTERGLFPARTALAAAAPGDLPLPATRANALIALAQGRPLAGIRGVGPWTRGYVALRTGDPDVLLTGDLIVRRALAALGAPTDRRALAALAERWRPFGSYATHHLWAFSARSAPGPPS